MDQEVDIQPSIFAQEQPLIEHASTGQRFVNLLIDTAVYYGIFLSLSYLYGALLAATGNADEGIAYLDTLPGQVLTTVVAYAVSILYLAISEGAGKGRTLGKLITGTRAVKADDSMNITWKAAFLRALSRCVPFEAFSGLTGHPWHDQWTNTTVIKVRRAL